MSISTGQWVFGLVGTWFILTALADVPATADLAAALALSVAATATFVLGPKASGNLFKAG